MPPLFMATTSLDRLDTLETQAREAREYGRIQAGLSRKAQNRQIESLLEHLRESGDCENLSVIHRAYWRGVKTAEAGF